MDKHLPNITLVPCESSQIAATAYDAESKTLAIQFKAKGGGAGNIYHYSNVPPELAAEFDKAESKGKFFGSRIKGWFDYEKIEPERDEPDSLGG